MTSKYIIYPKSKVKLEYANFKNSQWNSKDDLKDMLCRYGPVMVTMWADNPIFRTQTVTSKVLSCKKFKNRADHAVLLVGYHGSFWIVQNSWGKDWGNKGFFAISMDCGDISNYFQSYCFVESISEINFNEKYTEDTFDGGKLDWQIQEFYDKNLKTGFIPSPIENSELDTFYSNISQNKMVK